MDEKLKMISARRSRSAHVAQLAQQREVYANIRLSPPAPVWEPSVQLPSTYAVSG
jgi:hypothetical protein